MATHDFETKLDDALTQFAQGATRGTVSGCGPDATDLISLAEHLQILAPAPEPHLAEGRRKFLNEAARVLEPRASPRRALSFVVAAGIVLIVGGVLVIAAISGIAGVYVNPTLQATLTPTHAPTLSATPKSVLAPNLIAPERTHSALGAFLLPAASPTPTPAHARPTVLRLLALTWCSLDA